ncbi:hypothetical protein [Leucobacter celer]|uniref:hypothetical protein n=1 Tax=Leucobacter celer TaxID=668625 RepID=UPI000AC79088|nr:hypothetical protein [Leucobacter celer]
MTTDEFETYFQRLLQAMAEPTVADWMTAWAAIATCGIAVVALGYAGWQVSEAKKSRLQARDLELERSQPNVVVFCEPSKATPFVIDFVVKNYGLTAATEVTFDIHPWPERTNQGAGSERVELPSVIPVLAPGQEWRTMWDISKDRLTSTLPDRHTGTVSYKGVNGSDRSSGIDLDWSIYKSRRWMEVYSMYDAAKALREIKSTIKKWTESPQGALSVYTRDGHARDSEKRAAFEAYQAGVANQAASNGAAATSSENSSQKQSGIDVEGSSTADETP